jgi:DNA polymerase eta
LPIFNDDNDEPTEKLEEDWEDEEGEEERFEGRMTCWSDWALRIGADIMNDLREEIWKRLHYTTSAGVAHNKAMAKVRKSHDHPRVIAYTCSCARP